MKNDTIHNTEFEPVFIPDECGDTLWDEVLQQDVKTCDTKPGSPNAAFLLKNMSTNTAVDLDKK